MDFPEMASPQILSRGNFFLSTNNTFNPARRANKAVVLPAGPPPTTMAS